MSIGGLLMTDPRPLHRSPHIGQSLKERAGIDSPLRSNYERRVTSTTTALCADKVTGPGHNAT